MTNSNLPGTTRNILLIDDDEFIRELIAEYLNENGYQVFESGDGHDGLLQFQTIKPDIVLLDLRMPKLDGMKVLEMLVKNTPDIPVIIVSGQGTMSDVINALRLGAWDYLLKPIDDFNLLTYSIDKVLERASLIQQNKQHKRQLEVLNQQLELKVEDRTKELKQALNDLDSVNSSLKSQNIESIKMLSRIIELHPGIYKSQSNFITEKSIALAKQMDVDDADVQTIMIAGLLLQIGKISLTEKILLKPFYTLKTYERKEFLNHAIEGQKLLSGFEHLKDAAYLIRCQYERYDGSGFPDGLKANEIPLGARILTVVQDAFNYHTGVITGKKMPSWNDTFKKLIRNKDKYYDPKVLDLFVILTTGAPFQSNKLILEVDWFKLQPGMNIVVVKHKDNIFLKDKVASKELIMHIKELRKNVGIGLVIKVQVR
jgi:response regulator RpfG family c-di-GMP phosphodiesterase